ncbi:MAG: ferredoxin reductase [Nocardioides sp.]|nr:ferredoxin reductase [Nocardioides sp.]
MSSTRSIARRVLRSSTLAALTAPHGVDRYLELVNPMWAAREVRARVVSIERETDTANPVATLTLQPTSTWEGHVAGQHVQVGLELPGARRLTRVFSISSAASAPGEEFTLTIRSNDGGTVSSYLVEQARPGQVLHLSQALGEFVLPDPLPDRLVFLSGGSGITPVMAMTRTLLRDGYDGRITFLHYAQTPAHQIYADELAALAAADNGVDVHLVHPDAGGDLFTTEALATLAPDYRDVDAWACGPAGLVALVEDAYAGTERLRVEYFKTPTVATGDAEGSVAFTRSGEQAANSGATLLEQAEALGLTPEYGCRMGICFSCTSRKTEGTVRNVLTGEESALPDEDIRVCVSAPVGDCSVEL